MEKLPLGLTPRYIWRALRIKDIFEAMKRYSIADKPIPIEWINELEELLTENNNKEKK